MVKKKMHRHTGSLGFVIMAGLWLSACQNATNDQDRNSSGDSTDAGGRISPAQDMCFLKLSGAQGKDTLSVKLRISQGQVNGEMTESIFEKDARRGTLNGTLSGQSITAVWTYMQEGVTDTMKVGFELGNQQLQQLPLVFNSSSGRQQTDFRSSGRISIPEVRCTATGQTGALSVTGTVKEITNGKDGYMADLAGDDGQTYSITMSIIRLEKNYVRLNPGEKVAVSGDTVQLGEKVNILVKQVSKVK